MVNLRVLNRLRMKTKLILSYVFLIFITITIIYAILINSLTHAFIEETGKSNIEALNQISKSISLLLDGMAERMSALYSDGNVTNFLLDTCDLTYEEFSEYISYPYENVLRYRDLKKKLYKNSIIYSTLKSGIALITPHGQAVTSWDLNEYDFSVHIDQWKNHFKNSKSNILWQVIPGIESVTFTPNDGSSIFAGICYMETVDTGKNYGYMLIGIDEKNINNCYSGYVNRKPGGDIYILNKDGLIISSSEGGGSYIKDKLGFDVDKLVDNEGYFVDEIHGKQYMLSYVKIPSVQWNILHVIPNANIINRINNIYSPITAALVICCLGAVLLSIFFSYQFSNRLSKLKNAMIIAHKQDYKNRIEINSYDEIGDLANSFNTMIDMIKEYMNRIIREQENKRRAELDFLQAQINTHFLYNTLNSIKLLARMNRNDDIKILITSLVRLLNATIDNKNDIVSLREELENVYNYFLIQKIVHMKDIKLYIDCSEVLKEASIPKLLLQPIVENAILHGFLDSEGEDIIKIHISNDNKRLVISIIDNGVGMDKEELNNILSKKKFNKIGIKNVDDRIKLYYGKEFGVTVNSRKNIGTQVQIVLPHSKN